MEWPICRVVSSIPEAKLRFSGREFITVALLGELNRLEPTAMGNSKTGRYQIGMLSAKKPARKNPDAISSREPGPQPARVVPVVYPAAQRRQEEAQNLIGQQDEGHHYRGLPQPVFHQNGYQCGNGQHGQVEASIGEPGPMEKYFCLK